MGDSAEAEDVVRALREHMRNRPRAFRQGDIAALGAVRVTSVGVDRVCFEFPDGSIGVCYLDDTIS